MAKEENITHLSSFLADQSSDGETVMRDDHFTIAPEKAWEKLSAHALPFEEAWILELVRASVLSTCVKFEVKQSTARTIVILSKTSEWDIDLLLSALLEHQPDTPEYYRRIATAIGHLAKRLGNPFTIQRANLRILNWNGNRLDLEREPSHLPDMRPLAPADLVFSISNSAKEDRSFFSKMFKTEERAFIANTLSILHRKAFCSPVPLTVDSRSIRGLQALFHSKAGVVTRPLLQFRVSASRVLPAFPIPRMEDWEKPSTDDPVKVISKNSRASSGASSMSLADIENAEVGLIAILTMAIKKTSTKDSFLFEKSSSSAWEPGQGQSRLFWVQDGVVLQEENLHFGSVGLVLVAGAQGLKTDISGYHLIRNEQYELRRKAVLKAAAKSMLEVVEKNSFDHTQSVTMDPFSLSLRAVGGTLGLFLIVPGVLFFADIAYGHYRVTELESKCQAAFRKEFQEFGTRLNAFLEKLTPSAQK